MSTSPVMPEADRPTLTPAGWPRPKQEGSGLPIPWVSPSTDLSMMNDGRYRACASGSICAVCGLGYELGETAYALVSEDNRSVLTADLSDGEVLPMDNAVMHTRCLLLALASCPKLRELRPVLVVIKVPANKATPTLIEEPALDGKIELKALYDGADCAVRGSAEEVLRARSG